MLAVSKRTRTILFVCAVAFLAAVALAAWDLWMVLSEDGMTISQAMHEMGEENTFFIVLYTLVMIAAPTVAAAHFWWSKWERK